MERRWLASGNRLQTQTAADRIQAQAFWFLMGQSSRGRKKLFLPAGGGRQHNEEHCTTLQHRGENNGRPKEIYIASYV